MGKKIQEQTSTLKRTLWELHKGTFMSNYFSFRNLWSHFLPSLIHHQYHLWDFRKTVTKLLISVPTRSSLSILVVLTFLNQFRKQKKLWVVFVSFKQHIDFHILIWIQPVYVQWLLCF